VAESRAVLVLGVYRAVNATFVRELAREGIERGWTVRLWALDRADPELAAHTVGVSAGAKFPLLNELVRGEDLDRFDWIVVTDDDLLVRGGGIAEVLGVAEAAGLDLVQPAHVELSHRDNQIAVRRPLSLARRTTYVEIGPLFAVRRPWISQVLPFPAEHAMGWGLELDWLDLERAGARLGIVDAVPLRHMKPVGKEYAKGDELDRLRALLSDRGLASLEEVQRTVATWRPWQTRSPWQPR
jgi:hypothetical protein